MTVRIYTSICNCMHVYLSCRPVLPCWTDRGVLSHCQKDPDISAHCKCHTCRHIHSLNCVRLYALLHEDNLIWWVYIPLCDMVYKLYMQQMHNDSWIWLRHKQKLLDVLLWSQFLINVTWFEACSLLHPLHVACCNRTSLFVIATTPDPFFLT